MKTSIFVILLTLMTTLVQSQVMPDYIVIPQGCHHSSCIFHPGLNFLGETNVERDVFFTAGFASSCSYSSTSSHWNKLYRIDERFHHEDRSLRLGWRTNP